MEKKCCTCHKILALAEFNKNKGRKDGLNSICRLCSQKRSKQYYQDNKESHKVVVNKQRNQRRKKLKRLINNYKTANNGCTFCDEQELYCLDFHHLDPTEKEFDVSQLVSRTVTPARLIAEMQKCIIACSKCHKKIHKGCKLIAIKDMLARLNKIGLA